MDCFLKLCIFGVMLERVLHILMQFVLSLQLLYTSSISSFVLERADHFLRSKSTLHMSVPLFFIRFTCAAP